MRLLLASVVLLACIAVDSGRFGVSTPMLRRHTPQRLFYLVGATRGALLWGLDTGLMVTTFRITSLTWATLALCLLGVLPWWSGLAYAAGFVIPSAVWILAVPSRTGFHVTEPHWVMDRVSLYGNRIRRLAPAVFFVACLACVARLVAL